MSDITLSDKLRSMKCLVSDAAYSLIDEAASLLDPPKPEGPPKDGTVIYAWFGIAKHPIIVSWRMGICGYKWRGEGYDNMHNPKQWLPYVDPRPQTGPVPQAIKDAGTWIEAEWDRGPVGEDGNRNLYAWIVRWNKNDSQWGGKWLTPYKERTHLGDPDRWRLYQSMGGAK